MALKVTREDWGLPKHRTFKEWLYKKQLGIEAFIWKMKQGGE